MPRGSTALVLPERITGAILLIRRQKVILDATLAELYGVETRVLVQAVKRNKARFPTDFMFQLTSEEFDDLKSEEQTANAWGGRRTRPYAFTEQGIAMLSSVLHSKRAVDVNIEIMRAFVRLREMAVGHADLVKRIDDLEKQYDKHFRTVFEAIRVLIGSKSGTPKRIGFRAIQKERES